MRNTLTAADKTIVVASVSAERQRGDWKDSRDIRVHVTIGSLIDVDLVKPVEFFANVRLSNRIDGDGFEIDNIETPYVGSWMYDDDTDRVRYYYGDTDGEFVLVHDALIREVEGLIRDFIFTALWDAERAYETARNKALGL